MSLSVSADPSAADWLVQSGTPWNRLLTFGPAGFEAYARLRFIPDPVRPRQAEGDAGIPEDHPSDFAQARRAVHRLAPFTSTPEDCFFCLWDGYSDVDVPSAGRSPRVELPHRSYVLLQGSLSDIDDWERTLGPFPPYPPPAFVWPADHSWCFASDVDPHWAGIGASRAAVDALLGDPELDVVRARPDEPQPTYY
jgi:hypothetical protein